MNAVVRTIGLMFALSAGALVWGCDAGPTETDDPSESEADQEESDDVDEPESEALVCYPAKIPICGWGQSLVCEGAGTCRRCRCESY